MPDPTVQLRERPLPLVHRGARATATCRPLLHHVQLKTTRLDEMVAWYGHVLGLVVGFHGQGGAWLTNDDANHRLAFVTSPRLAEDPDQLTHAGLHHTAWEFSDVDELLGTYERLRDEGILPHRTVDHGPILSFYYVDPDGNSVELQVDNYGDWRESARFFDSEAFARDPYGPGVDPEALVAARRAGATGVGLHHRAYAGEFPNTRPNDRRFPG
jgi:catechol 2,3-dioxygenase-like lactoylglutathione lyase family enzyme